VHLGKMRTAKAVPCVSAIPVVDRWDRGDWGGWRPGRWRRRAAILLSSNGSTALIPCRRASAESWTCWCRRQQSSWTWTSWWSNVQIDSPDRLEWIGVNVSWPTMQAIAEALLPDRSICDPNWQDC
jgi:hypothetical protein